MDSRIEKMADALVNYSLAVQPGERVLIRSTSPAGEPLTQALYQAALRAGGEAFTYIHLRDEDSLAIEATDDIDLLAAVMPRDFDAAAIDRWKAVVDARRCLE